MYRRRKRADRIEEIHERQIADGLLYVTVTKDDEGRELKEFRNRTLTEACEWRAKNGSSKKKIIDELNARLDAGPGEREAAKLKSVIERFSDDS